MADSTFDKEAFMAASQEGESEVKFSPVPEGEYQAFIDDIDMTEYNNQQGVPVPVLQVTYAVLDDNVKAELNMEKPTIRDNIFLDMEEDGRLAFGPNKNVRLGRIRDAVGQNTSAPWNFNMLRGAGPVNIKVSHNMSKKGEGPFANIDRVAAA